MRSRSLLHRRLIPKAGLDQEFSSDSEKPFRAYFGRGKNLVILKEGRLEPEEESCVLVNSANKGLYHGAGVAAALMPSSHCTIFKVIGLLLFSHCTTIWGSIQTLLFSHCTMDRPQEVTHCMTLQ